MVRKFSWLPILILSIALLITACKEDTTEVMEDIPLSPVSEMTEASQESDTPQETQESEQDSSEATSGTDKIDTITDFSDEWTRLYQIHEGVINSYEGMPIIALPMSAMPLANSIFYSLLNLENKDGEYSGIIGFGVEEGYYNKSGNTITFGQDSIRKEDGFSSNEKTGDQLITKGLFDADQGYLKYEYFVTRDGSPISTTHAEYQLLSDGRLNTLYATFTNYNNNGDIEKNTNLVFISMSDDQYDFVLASGSIDLANDTLLLQDNMTTKDAEKMFKELGAQITEWGGITDGQFVVNQP